MTTPRSTFLLVALCGAASLAGCRGERSDAPPREFLPDMDNSPKFKPQTRTEFFPDGRAMRPEVPHTVAFGTSINPADAHRIAILKDDDAYYRGTNAKGDFIDAIPVPVTKELIARGQARFNIYCSACHGFAGDAQGMVSQRWAGGSANVANFHLDKYKDATLKTGQDGYVFHVIRNGVVSQDGKQTMPSYAHAVNEQDAWAIVSYIRVLQASRTGVEAAPANERSRLEGLRPQLVAKADAEAAAKKADEEKAKKKPANTGSTPPPANPAAVPKADPDAKPAPEPKKEGGR